MSQFICFMKDGKALTDKANNDFEHPDINSKNGFTQCEKVSLGVRIVQTAGDTVGQRQWDAATAVFDDDNLYTLLTKALIENTQLEAKLVTMKSDPAGGTLGEQVVQTAMFKGVKITETSLNSESGEDGKRSLERIAWKFDQVEFDTKDPKTKASSAFADLVKKVTGKG